MPNKPAKSYSQLNEELDNVLVTLQSGNLDIDEAVKFYERGNELIKQLETYLKEAENKITKVKAQLEKS